MRSILSYALTMRDVCICIPVINNSHLTEHLILDCLDRNPGVLIVVDDALPMPLEASLCSHQVQRSIRGGQLKIIRHSKNLGRVDALQTGYDLARNLGFEQIITVEEPLTQI